MKTVTICFVVPDEDEEAIDNEIRHSPLLKEWPVVEWSVRSSTIEEKVWYRREYPDDEVAQHTA